MGLVHDRVGRKGGVCSGWCQPAPIDLSKLVGPGW